jgi:hypothetical protein
MQQAVQHDEEEHMASQPFNGPRRRALDRARRRTLDRSRRWCLNGPRRRALEWALVEDCQLALVEDYQPGQVAGYQPRQVAGYQPDRAEGYQPDQAEDCRAVPVAVSQPLVVRAHTDRISHVLIPLLRQRGLGHYADRLAQAHQLDL